VVNEKASCQDVLIAPIRHFGVTGRVGIHERINYRRPNFPRPVVSSIGIVVFAPQDEDNPE